MSKSLINSLRKYWNPSITEQTLIIKRQQTADALLSAHWLAPSFLNQSFLTKMGWTKSAKYEITYTFGAYFVNMPIFKAVIIYLLWSTLLLPLFNCKISADFESNYRRPPSSLPKKDSSLLTINQKRNKCIL